MPAYLTRLQCGAGRTQCMGQSAIGGRHVSLWQTWVTLTIAKDCVNDNTWWKQAWLGPQIIIF